MIAPKRQAGTNSHRSSNSLNGRNGSRDNLTVGRFGGTFDALMSSQSGRSIGLQCGTGSNSGITVAAAAFG
jgi:hypothetical protein